MCMFSGPVPHVGSTEIYVGDLGGGIHATVYRMSVRVDEPLAMILPVPIVPGSGDDALAFVDLSGYERFFEGMRGCFPAPLSRGSLLSQVIRTLSMEDAPLVVHEVGEYVASYVPSIDEFRRLDPRFRLPAVVWDTLPDYGDFGFAVFQLLPGDRMRTVHPIAYRYPAARPGELFFPAVHVHDGRHAEPKSRYDHTFYLQSPSTCRLDGWEVGLIKPGAAMAIAETRGMVAPDIPLRRSNLNVLCPNADIVVVAGDDEPRTLARRVPGARTRPGGNAYRDRGWMLD